VRAYIGVTDGDWYRFLLGRPDLDEVNFWQPSGSRKPFRAIQSATCSCSSSTARRPLGGGPSAKVTECSR